MRSALQTLLARPYALSVLRNAVYSDSFMFCRCNSLRASNGEQARVDIGKERRGLANTHQPLSYRPLEDSAVAVGSKIKEEVDNAIECVYEQQNVSRRSVTTDGSVLENLEAMEIPQYLEQTESPRVPELTPLVGEPSRKLQLEPPAKADGRKKSWEGRLSTFEQYQYEADLQVHQGLHLVDDPVYAEDWKLWLELIGFRKRHYGTQGTMAVFENIIQRKLAMPTRGTVGKELWHQLFQAGFHDHEFLEAIVAYAIELMQSTGRFWSRMYRSVIAHFLRTDPRSAYRWHVRLKQIFPPALKDYQVLFKLSLDCNSNAEFRNLYTDLPLPGLYQVAIPGLCELQRYSEALKWHYLLCMTKDPPSQFHEIKPLLAHLAHIGDSQQLETIIKGLNEAQVSFSGSVDFFIRKRDFISREIMNRRLGEVHGIGAKHLSDGFCARLFATRLFSIDTVINGLQMMAAEVIGPLSLREIASRDDCDPIAIRRHIERLNDAGVTLDQSPFSTLVRNLAVEGNHKILRSLVDCDLHPDIFKDYNLQERLLAQYYDEDDPVKVERTLAMLTVGCNEDNLPTVRMNVILRSQITLRRKEAVLSMLELMKQMGIPISSRSSRHLRVCWLSRRQVGRNPGQTRELSVIILASQRTMQSGRFVPIIAWREILRRLGMSGRLTEFENLVIWLVDWYSSPAAKTALPYQKLLPSNDDKSAVKAHIEAQTLLDKNRNPQRFLNVLFTTSAQHAIVSWGFQKTARDNQNAIRRFYPGLVVQHRNRLDWTWGLNLLRTLRERGVPIQKFSVARVCKQRLNALFGPRTSKRRINRRMKRLNDKRALALEKYTAAAYVRKMKEIWGSDLFRNQDVTKFLQEDWQRPVKSKNRSPPVLNTHLKNNALRFWATTSELPCQQTGEGQLRGSNSSNGWCQEARMAAKLKTYGKKKAHGLITAFENITLSPDKKTTEPSREVLAEISPNKAGKPNVEKGVNDEVKKTQQNGRPSHSRLGHIQIPENSELRPLLDLECVRSEVRHFHDVADAWVKTLKLIKVAEGSYAAVYRAQLKDNPGTFRILKLIPLRPREGLGSHQEDQTPIKDAIAEIQVSATMSEIPGFAEFASAQVLQGGLPKEFLQVNRDWSMTLNEKERAEIPNRANYPNTQNWLVIEMMDAGISLESVLYRGLPRWGSSFETQRLTVKRTWDIFWSVAEALADGEERARFEHRDLHPGNICIKKLDASDRNQSDIKQQRVTRESDVQVTLIDYTLSRATLADGTIVSNPMAVELCEQHSDDENDEMQYNLYRSMRKMVEGRQRAVSDWEKYVPMTNVLWLYHILTMMLRMIPSRRGRIGEEELVLQRTLTKLQADMHPDRIHVWDYLEAEDVVKGHEIGKLLMLDQVAYGTGDGDEIGRSVDYTGEGEHMTSARARRHKRVIDKREGRQY